MSLLHVENLSIGILRNGTPGRSGGRTGQEELLGAVKEVSFDIQPSEIVGLVGESGCGKSLSALSIPRLLSPEIKISGGNIFFEGRALNKLSERELQNIRGKEISMIFQEPGSSLNPLLKIGAQIEETLFLHGETDEKIRRRRALDLMEKLGLAGAEKLLDAYPHQLSGGMAQRVMIAIAAICRPKLLIADEPTTALDTHTQSQILDLLAGINREFGTAILFISHDLAVIKHLCSRVLVMYAGKIVEEGKVQDVFSAPAHPYTRRLIEAIPRRENRGKPLANIRGAVPSIEENIPGCPFAPRCDLVQDRCRVSFPPKKDTGNAHIVYCLEALNHAE
jgi:peptide/nickel transport system ATP-binding protein